MLMMELNGIIPAVQCFVCFINVMLRAMMHTYTHAQSHIHKHTFTHAQIHTHSKISGLLGAAPTQTNRCSSQAPPLHPFHSVAPDMMPLHWATDVNDGRNAQTTRRELQTQNTHTHTKTDQQYASNIAHIHKNIRRRLLLWR